MQPAKGVPVIAGTGLVASVRVLLPAVEPTKLGAGVLVTVAGTLVGVDVDCGIEVSVGASVGVAINASAVCDATNAAVAVPASASPGNAVAVGAAVGGLQAAHPNSAAINATEHLIDICLAIQQKYHSADLPALKSMT